MRFREFEYQGQRYRVLKRWVIQKLGARGRWYVVVWRHKTRLTDVLLQLTK